MIITGEIFHKNFSRDRNLDGNFLQFCTQFTINEQLQRSVFFTDWIYFELKENIFCIFIFSTQFFFPKAQFLHFIQWLKLVDYNRIKKEKKNAIFNVNSACIKMKRISHFKIERYFFSIKLKKKNIYMYIWWLLSFMEKNEIIFCEIFCKGGRDRRL